MSYIDRAPAPTQDPTPEKISGPNGASASKPSNVVTDLRSRDNWMKTFNAIAAHDRRINKAALALGNRLALYHRIKTGQCNPSVKELAAEFGVSESTINRGIKTLTTAGWISRKRGGRYDTADVLFHVPDDSSIPVNVVTGMAEAPYPSDSASIPVTQGDVTEEQRNREERSAGASPPARAAGVESLYITTASEKDAADALSQSQACNTDILDTPSAPVRRLVSIPVDRKDRAETQVLNAPCCPIPVCVTNGADIDHRNGHAARRPDTEPHHEVSKIMTDAINGAEKHPRGGFQLRKLTPEESRRLARRTEYFAKMRREYRNQPDAEADEVEALFNRMLLDIHSFTPLVKTYVGLMNDRNEGRIAVEDMPTLKTLLAENWQRVHESGRRAQRTRPIEDARVAA
jgi:AraC-like DNA-binding protein